METTIFFGIITTPYPIELAYLIGATGTVLAIGLTSILAIIIEKLVNTRVGQWLITKLF